MSSKAQITFQDDQSERYDRLIKFWTIGKAGQLSLAKSHVAVIGCGALGCTNIDLLVRSGVGTLTIVDKDFVELSNLQRQSLFTENDVIQKLPKAIAAAEAVKRTNSQVTILPIIAHVTSENIEQLITQVDLIIDSSDNIETRYLINDLCIKRKIPWIYGGALGSTGMSMTIIPDKTPCLRCHFPTPPLANTLKTSATTGILGSTIHCVASIQYTEALKILIGNLEHINRGLVMFDLWNLEFNKTDQTQIKPQCPCCIQKKFEFLNAKVGQKNNQTKI